MYFYEGSHFNIDLRSFSWCKVRKKSSFCFTWTSRQTPTDVFLCLILSTRKKTLFLGLVPDLWYNWVRKSSYRTSRWSAVFSYIKLSSRAKSQGRSSVPPSVFVGGFFQKNSRISSSLKFELKQIVKHISLWRASKLHMLSIHPSNPQVTTAHISIRPLDYVIFYMVPLWSHSQVQHSEKGLILSKYHTKRIS